MERGCRTIYAGVLCFFGMGREDGHPPTFWPLLLSFSTIMLHDMVMPLTSRTRSTLNPQALILLLNSSFMVNSRLKGLASQFGCAGCRIFCIGEAAGAQENTSELADLIKAYPRATSI